MQLEMFLVQGQPRRSCRQGNTVSIPPRNINYHGWGVLEQSFQFGDAITLCSQSSDHPFSSARKKTWFTS